MDLSVRETIGVWDGAVKQAAGSPEQALHGLMSILDTSAKIHFNVAVLHAQTGKLDRAIEVAKALLCKWPPAPHQPRCSSTPVRLARTSTLLWRT